MTDSQQIDAASPIRIAVLVSGGGTNLQALIDADSEGNLGATIAGVISNVPGAYALTRAARAGLEHRVIDHKRYACREAFDEALVEELHQRNVDLVVLAGFMRILSPAFFEGWTRPMMNIHPALLPAYPGTNTHARALADGAQWHGATVHFVIPALDAGPRIIQDRCCVCPDDTPDTLAARVLALEHRIYPEAIRWFAAGRLTVEDGEVLLDGIRDDAQGLDATV